MVCPSPNLKLVSTTSHACKPVHHTIPHSNEMKSQISDLRMLEPKHHVSTLLTTTSIVAQEREESMVKV
jgi:hypothetical protein